MLPLALCLEVVLGSSLAVVLGFCWGDGRVLLMVMMWEMRKGGDWVFLLVVVAEPALVAYWALLLALVVEPGLAPYWDVVWGEMLEHWSEVPLECYLADLLVSGSVLYSVLQLVL